LIAAQCVRFTGRIPADDPPDDEVIDVPLVSGIFFPGNPKLAGTKKILPKERIFSQRDI
jgi:hypothetical protein